MYYTKLIKEFNNGEFDNTYLFHGEEQYIIDNLINYLIDQVDPVYRDFNVKLLDWEKNEIEDILSNLETLPFMGDHTFTVVNNVDKMNKELDDTGINQLKKYLKSPNESSVLIFLARNIDKRKKMYKALKKHSRIEEFRKLNNNELNKWINKYLSDHDKKIKSQTLNYLIQSYGYLNKNSDIDLYYITQSLEKIIGYSDKKEITREVIDKFVEQPIENNIFLLTDALLNSNVEQALNILNLMDEKGEPLILVLFMIIKQFRTIFKIKILTESGLTAKVASKTIGIHPYAGEKAYNQCKKINYHQLRKLMEISIATDKRSKTTGTGNRLLIEYLIAEANSIINI
ncbi:MAG TPA: DNA polymerase III subunit delta [Clostridia bacterium]|nr:DNA polymerase III subunit delta [Clostridia bacterium]